MRQAAQKLQLTLAILKPDVIARPHVAKEIRQIIVNDGFLYARSQRLYLPRQQAELFYQEHREKFFFNRLVSYMSSGQIAVHILARTNAIKRWRELMGPTKVFRSIHSDPETIRGRFGLSDTRNCTHGSDSDESAKREMQFFFPEFDVDKWLAKDEFFFRDGDVVYDEDRQEHVIQGDE